MGQGEDELRGEWEQARAIETNHEEQYCSEQFYVVIR